MENDIAAIGTLIELAKSGGLPAVLLLLGWLIKRAARGAWNEHVKPLIERHFALMEAQLAAARGTDN